MNQGNTARNAKVQFLKMFFWIPFIAVIAVIFPISRSRRPNSRYRGIATTANYPCVCSLPLTETQSHPPLSQTVEEFVKQDSVPSSESGVFYSLLFLLLEHSFKYIKAVDSLSLILVSHPGPAVEVSSEKC